LSRISDETTSQLGELIRASAVFVEKNSLLGVNMELKMLDQIGFTQININWNFWRKSCGFHETLYQRLPGDLRRMIYWVKYFYISISGINAIRSSLPLCFLHFDSFLPLRGLLLTGKRHG